MLIPTRDNVCVSLVRSLAGQAIAIDRLEYEILVVDDGSTNAQSVEENKQINDIPHCEYIVRRQNVGRSAIRNYLATQAKYGSLLFVDSGVSMGKEDFLRTYLSQSDYNFGVVCGGWTTSGDGENTRNSLRYMYEKSFEKHNSAHERSRTPYKSFRTVNFMVRKDIILSTPFNTNIVEYGYEDVLFGKSLKQKQVNIEHIDNPVDYRIHDTNETFLAKTEAALRTLSAHKSELKGYSWLLRMVELSHKLYLSVAVNAIFKLLKNKWRTKLSSDNPTLYIYNLYRVGYLSSIL